MINEELNLALHDNMTVVRVEPGKPAFEKKIGTGLESLQQEVDGYIEAIYPFEDEVAIICNEEGKITGLPLNRALRDEDGEIYDIIAGNFLIVGLTEENFGSLSPEQVETFLEKYKMPELFLRIDGEIKAIPSDRPDLVPVYLNGPDYAYDHREQSAYRQSFRTNLQCKSAIEAALSENYANNTLNTERVWQQVTGTFGKERVVALLASTCCELKHDGRISNANIAWAADQPMLPDRIVIEKPHIGLVDLLVTRARKEMAKEKKSVLEKLEAAKSNLTPAAPKTDRKKEQSL